jgi:cysteine desulfurase/selenocysteine lyase
MNVRNDFPILKRGIYFDNAATSQKPVQVLEAVNNYYLNHNSNVHRGIHFLSEESTEIYEDTKKKFASFINAPDWEEIIYTKNATESLNLSCGLCGLKKGDKVVTTIMEHHSNFLPWQVLEKSGVRFEVANIDSEGFIDMDDLIFKAKGAKVIAVTHASNVLGTINPVEEISKISREEDAILVVDAAQSAPHMKIDISKIGADFVAFSGHKMLAPMGIGMLYARKDRVADKTPLMPGGGTIEDVTDAGPVWSKMPERFEGGTPNVGGAVGLRAAVEYLEKIGMDNVRSHELSLLKKFFSLSPDYLEIYGPSSPSDRTGLVSFNIPGIHSHDVADFLNGRKIAVRSGKHCAHPLHQWLGIPGSVRASFYIYNTEEEISKLFEALEEVKGVFL